MICDQLSEEEIYQAYLIYASLHGLSTDEDSIRTQIADYVAGNSPNETIDEAVLAYLEDRIIAPPDIVLAQWGSSRYYELCRSFDGGFRHEVSESWFENGCSFPSGKDAPRLAHCWIEFRLDAEVEIDSLAVGMRVRFELDEPGAVRVSHRELALLGQLPAAIARELHRDALRIRKFLPLVDKGWQPAPTCKLLVTTSTSETPSEELVAYAAAAFDAPRCKC